MAFSINANDRVLIVMGVSGAGKTTVGKLLAERLGWTFADGDDLHSPAEIAKMHAGHALDDADRGPWLTRLSEQIDAWLQTDGHAVLACSALKRAYRETLIGKRANVGLVYLRLTFEQAASRVAARHGHFMPAALLASQFAALEPPGPDERPLTVAADGTPQQTVDRVLALL